MTGRFIVNVNSNGKIHLLMNNSAEKPIRVKCGWKISNATSRIFHCYRLKYGKLCLKCFPVNEKRTDDEEIEQYDDLQ